MLNSGVSCFSGSCPSFFPVELLFALLFLCLSFCAIWLSFWLFRRYMEKQVVLVYGAQRAGLLVALLEVWVRRILRRNHSGLWRWFWIE